MTQNASERRIHTKTPTVQRNTTMQRKNISNSQAPSTPYSLFTYHSASRHALKCPVSKSIIFTFNFSSGAPVRDVGAEAGDNVWRTHTRRGRPNSDSTRNSHSRRGVGQFENAMILWRLRARALGVVEFPEMFWTPMTSAVSVSFACCRIGAAAAREEPVACCSLPGWMKFQRSLTGPTTWFGMESWLFPCFGSWPAGNWSRWMVRDLANL